MAYYKRENLPSLDRLFEALSAGQTPDFLQMMSALSDVSTIWPDNDSLQLQARQLIKKGQGVSLYPNFQPRCNGRKCG